VSRVYKGLQNDLQSRSATTSLLMKSYKCTAHGMKEELELLVVLALKSRHIVKIGGMKQRRRIPAEEITCG